MFGNSNLIEALILLMSMGLLNSQIQDMNRHKVQEGIWDMRGYFWNHVN